MRSDWFYRLRALFRRRAVKADLDRELRFHPEHLAEKYRQAGLPDQDIERRLRLDLGGSNQIREECRDARGTRWLEDLIKDTGHSLRVFLQSPSFTIAAVIAIALGIGANTAVFSVVNTVLLKPLPFPDADRIVQFEDTYAGAETPSASPKSFNLYRQQTTAFEDISAHWLDHVNLTAGSDAELAPAAIVSADYFRLYGAPVLHGRTFTTDEDRPGGGHVVVLSYEFWTRRFGSAPDIVGKSISLGDGSYVVVGVLGPFDTAQFDQSPDVWVPFQIDPANKDTDSRLCYITGRLKTGVTLDMARAELQLAAEAKRRALPGSMRPKDGFSVEPLRDAMVGDVRPSLLILAGAVGFVLLIACANVANLLLVRAEGRMREMAIRAALGAGRGRIVRQLLTESVFLSTTGGILGLALGWTGIHGFLALYPSTPLGGSVNRINIPRIGEAGAALTMDWRVLAFTVLATLVTGVLFGIVPALHVSRADLNAPLKESSGRSNTAFGRTKTLSLLVICEMTLALVLLIGGGLLIRTSIALRSVNPGFDSRDVLTMQTSLAGTHFGRATATDQLVRDSIQRIKALPGVQSAAVSCCLPLETVWQLPYIVQGRALNGRFHGFAGWTFISADYFEVLRVPLLRGRTFSDLDTAAAPGVIIINQTMARMRWPTSDPLHDSLLIGRTFGPQYAGDPVRQIVGIVGDVRDQGLNRKPRPIMYVPIAQVPDGVKALEFPLLPIAWIVRTRERPQTFGNAIAKELRLASGGLPVARVRSMEEVARQSTARTQFNTMLMSVFGCAALLLAAIGIYGLMAYSIRQRAQEIAIRIALGARPQDVMRMILFQGVRLVLIGVVNRNSWGFCPHASDRQSAVWRYRPRSHGLRDRARFSDGGGSPGGLAPCSTSQPN
jgi:putative ABC transport system permease protein